MYFLLYEYTMRKEFSKALITRIRFFKTALIIWKKIALLIFETLVNLELNLIGYLVIKPFAHYIRRRRIVKQLYPLAILHSQVYALILLHNNVTQINLYFLVLLKIVYLFQQTPEVNSSKFQWSIILLLNRLVQ